MKVLVCGDRDWQDRALISTWLWILKGERYDEVIEGEARGADTIAREEAEKLGTKVSKFPAGWAKYGRAAGVIRNRQMLDEKPDLVLAFHSDLKKSRGTKDTVQEAYRRKIPVMMVEGL